MTARWQRSTRAEWAQHAIFAGCFLSLFASRGRWRYRVETVKQIGADTYQRGEVIAASALMKSEKECKRRAEQAAREFEERTTKA